MTTKFFDRNIFIFLIFLETFSLYYRQNNSKDIEKKSKSVLDLNIDDMGRWRFMFSLVALIVNNVANAWYITPPRHNSEWKEMVQLLVQTFDAPRRNSSSLDKLRWSLAEQSLTEAYTFRQYTQTAKRMRGKKYSIFVAKELGRVIGMAEVGINGANSEKRPTIGLICVEEAFRQQGIAADLVKHCEHLVTNVWNETTLYAEVEPTNAAALQFFYSQDFQSVGNYTVNVNVRRGLAMEERPHLLLSKELPAPKESSRNMTATHFVT
jgi:ribosomal protein S18 acetylase RimI-like enzyme